MATKLQRKIDEAESMIDEKKDELQEAIDKIDKMLRPYEALKEQQNKLRAALRALHGGNRTTGEGTDNLTREELAAYLGENPGSKPGDIAKHFGMTQPRVSSALYRGKGDGAFLTKDRKWWLRDPENGINDESDLEEEDE